MPLQAGKKFAELAGRKRRPQQQNTKPIFVPPQQGGINAIAGAATAPITDALFMVNMVPSEFGVAVRLGYREYCQPVPAGSSGIRTLIPVEPQDVALPKKMFAVTNDGIYDASAAGAVPIKVQDFATKGDPAGWCSWTNMTTLAGQFLLVCDMANGYYYYNVGTGVWTKVTYGTGAGQISEKDPADGVADPTTFEFVIVWKNRVWFIQRNSGKAWFLPAGTVVGSGPTNGVDAFAFGNKFKVGGQLKALYNWTLDGGEGVDDYLVALSSAGDMLVYKGTDPATTDFIMHGSWWVGRVPEGRRVGDDNTSDLLILSAYGVIQPSKLVAGLPLTDAQASISYKINPRINEVLQRSIHLHGWQIKQDPKNQLTFVITPKELGLPYQQFVYHTVTKGWAQFVGIPMQTAEVWDGQMYLGDADRRIYRYSGNTDRAMLDDGGVSATAIEWESLTTFQNFGLPAQFKRVQMMRPMFIGGSVPAYQIAARYDFDISQLPGSPAYVAPAGGLWGSGIWGTDVWGGGYIVNQPPYGGKGIGRHIAISIRGRSSADTTHVGTDVLFDVGGML